MEKYDLIIIGAGPAGLGCAISAVKKDIKVLLIDKGNIVDSIIRCPTDMTFFSTSDVLELHKIPFNSRGIRPTRAEAVKYYQSLVNYFRVPVRTGSNVHSITCADELFTVNYKQYGSEHAITSKNLVIATGFYDQPNMLGIPGEDLPHVSHYYREPYQHFQEKVVIVGGKNSAVESALELFRCGAQVTIIHRRADIEENVKYWILPDIRNRINEGSIKAYFKATVSAISPQTIDVLQKEQRFTLTADAVYLLTGYHPDTTLLEKVGVRVDSKTLIPEINPQTLETNIKGCYLAGSIIAGKNANKIFIENSRAHGEKIIQHLLNGQRSD